MPYFQLEKGDSPFPPAHFADLDGLLAVGGDMNESRLLQAYREGIFYWHHPMKHLRWWSPDPRTVLFPGDINLAALPNWKNFKNSESKDIIPVLRFCQKHYNRPEAMGPQWLSERMFRIFSSLHKQGLLYAEEVWLDRQLVGAFFGVCLDDVFHGEYVAESVPGAATQAICSAVRSLSTRVHLMDMQKETARDATLEYEQISRLAYVDHCKSNAKSSQFNPKPQME
jgi:leucyl/phenylalanyl-tRNA--protein transferase